jgi:hypothetical protein
LESICQLVIPRRKSDMIMIRNSFLICTTLREKRLTRVWACGPCFHHCRVCPTENRAVRTAFVGVYVGTVVEGIGVDAREGAGPVRRAIHQNTASSAPASGLLWSLCYNGTSDLERKSCLVWMAGLSGPRKQTTFFPFLFK